jgi:uncharacterized protein (TIGR02266 family)
LPCDSRPDARKQPRVTCTLSVQVHAPSEDVLLFTYATDISHEGVYVRANRPLPVGARVHLDLQPHAPNERLTIDGTVVRIVENGSGPRGMGVAFVDADEQALEGIRQLVERVDYRTMLTAGDAETYSTFAKEREARPPLG